MTWFKGQAADFYDSGIQKLVPRLNKCLDNAGGYVENKVMFRQFIHSVAFVNEKCCTCLTLRLLISYIYGAPSKARNANVVYIWTYVWQR